MTASHRQPVPFRAGAFAACIALFAAPGLRADWPTVMHDNERTGVTEERLRFPLACRWVYRSPAPPADGWSLPVNGYGVRKNKPNVNYDDAYRVIAVGDSCYFSSSAENAVCALDAGTGTVRWRRPVGAAPRLAPVYNQGRLYVGADDGILRCLEATAGEVLWTVDAAPDDDWILGHGRFHSAWPIRAGSVLADGVVYLASGLFPSSHIYLWAVDAGAGRVLWRRQLDREGSDSESPQGYMVASADSLFVPSRVAPVRRRRSDGARLDFDTPFPPIRDNHQYRFYNGGSEVQLRKGSQVVYGQGCILAYDPDAPRQDKYGRERRGKLLFNWFNARRMLFRDELAFVATDTHLLAVKQALLPEMAAAELRDFELAYKDLRIASYLDALERYERLCRERGPDDQEAASLRNGPLKWGKDRWERWPETSARLTARITRRCEWMVPARVPEAMILAGDTVIAGGETGVAAYRAADGERVWTARTGSRVRDLAVAAGRLFVSCVDGSVRCFTTGPDAGPAAAAAPQTITLAPPPPRLQPLVSHAVAAAGARGGYGLLLAGDVSEAEALAAAMARHTTLHLVVVPAGRTAPSALRDRLTAAGLHGHRIEVCAWTEEGDLPLAPYLFDVVLVAGVGDAGRDEGRIVRDALARTKPCGGTVLLLPELGHHVAAERVPAGFSRADAPQLTALKRGPLPRATDWNHNYANAANTYCSEDPLVRGPFGILWYGEPGPRQRIDRHAAPPMPLVVNGTLYTLGYDRVMAYDVYNGTARWDRRLPGATRTHLPIATSNLAADPSGLFVVVGNRRCLRLDPGTGATVATLLPPREADGREAYWGWIACVDGMLYGTCADVDEGRRRPRRQTAHALFALDVAGDLVWQHNAEGIDQDGVAIDDGRVFFVDRDLSGAERAVAGAPGPAAPPGDDVRASPDLRALNALDSRTGHRLWRRPFDATDITGDDRAVLGRAGVACMAKDGVVVVHGIGSLGHPHREFLAGAFDRRALYAFSASDGRLLWGGRKGYRKRPIIVGDHVFAEPWAWHLQTGLERTVDNPLSGCPQRLDVHRGYIGCGHLLASAGALFGARRGIAFWNLDSPAGFSAFANMALACGICAVPANGVFAVPEGRSGCACDTPLFASLALYPRPQAGFWADGFAGGRSPAISLPVRHVAVNLGASRFREDVRGGLWLPYPARLEPGVIGDWLPTYQHDAAMCFRLDDGFTRIENTDLPWLYRTGYAHVKPLEFTLRRDKDGPGVYDLTLHFVEPEIAVQAGRRRMDVKVQGQTVISDLDVVAAAGGAHRAWMERIAGVRVEETLTIELCASEGSTGLPPLLCGFELRRSRP